MIFDKPRHIRKKPRSLTERDYKQANIGRRYWRASLEDIDTDEAHETALRGYCENIHRFYAKGLGLFFMGPNGRGKTYGSVCLLKHALSLGYSGYFVFASKLQRIRIDGALWNDDMTLWERLETVDFLVIDDMGKEHKSSSDFTGSLIDELLRQRSYERKVTHITTNLNLEGFHSRYGLSVTDVLKESFVPLVVQGSGNQRDAIAERVRE